MKIKGFILIMFLPIFTFAQHLEAGIMAGASNYLGDLSVNSSRVVLKETHFSGGLFVRYNINDYAAVRLGGQFGTISGTDANAKEEKIRERNLSFRSNIYDFSLTGEFNILGYQPYNLYRPFSPYIFAGIALTKFDPTTVYQDSTIHLQPLGTEGQGMADRPEPYKLTEFAIPFGIGVKYAINDTWNIGFEIGARYSFSDYLDDVSSTYVRYEELLAGNGALAAALGNRTGEYLDSEPVSVPTGTPRGDNDKTDWYFIMGFTISYNFLDNGLVGSRGRNSRKAGCTKF